MSPCCSKDQLPCQEELLVQTTLKMGDISCWPGLGFCCYCAIGASFLSTQHSSGPTSPESLLSFLLLTSWSVHLKGQLCGALIGGALLFVPV